MSRESDFITEARTEVRKIWEAYHALLNMQTDIVSLCRANVNTPMEQS